MTPPNIRSAAANTKLELAVRQMVIKLSPQGSYHI